MTLAITKHSEIFSSCPQINPEDITEIKSLGYKTIINARPDLEGGSNQPTSENIKIAAEKAGLKYIHIPVVPNNIGANDIQLCSSFVDSAPTPVLGFCRTGMRASNLYHSSQKKDNTNTNMGNQNWLTKKVNDFFKNKCLITKLYRKLSKANV
jgi:uncharacterized protein (TIGR01244 family)